MAFFIEKSRDKYGNRGYPAAVVEGTLSEEHGLPSIKLIGPADFIGDWSSVLAQHFQEVSAEAGPARLLTGRPSETSKEMDRLIVTFSV